MRWSAGTYTLADFQVACPKYVQPEPSGGGQKSALAQYGTSSVPSRKRTSRSLSLWTPELGVVCDFHCARSNIAFHLKITTYPGQASGQALCVTRTK